MFRPGSFTSYLSTVSLLPHRFRVTSLPPVATAIVASVAAAVVAATAVAAAVTGTAD